MVDRLVVGDRLSFLVNCDNEGLYGKAVFSGGGAGLKNDLVGLSRGLLLAFGGADVNRGGRGSDRAGDFGAGVVRRLAAAPLALRERDRG